jgi:hypothetical protein
MDKEYNSYQKSRKYKSDLWKMNQFPIADITFKNETLVEIL